MTLLNGIAVIIDDEINDENANIFKLKQQIKEENIPCLELCELPDENEVRHFGGVSFLILDWKLKSHPIGDMGDGNVTIPDTFEQENIQFLQELEKTCFIPVFIFTNEDVGYIKSKLVENNLYQEDSSNYIFVKDKAELEEEGKLIEEINEWLYETPSIYALKTWQKAYKNAENDLFHDFYKLSPDWPTILWDTFTEDSVNESLELGEIISKNLYTRMSPFEFSEDILKKDGVADNGKELHNVIEGERFVRNNRLHDDTIAPGDVFKRKGGGGRIFINLRSACDCIPRGDDENIDDVELYLLFGKILSEEDLRDKYLSKNGFVQRNDSTVVLSMLDGQPYEFKFKTLTLKKWTEVKDKRLGRLLPPYITDIQQRYALYFTRQGLLRVPEIAVEEETPSAPVPAAEPADGN